MLHLNLNKKIETKQNHIQIETYVIFKINIQIKNRKIKFVLDFIIFKKKLHATSSKRSFTN